MQVRVAIFVAAGLLVLAPATSRAAGDEAAECRAEIRQVCPESEDRRDRMTCVRENEDEFSPKCRAFIEKGRERGRAKFRELRKACNDDAATYCPDAKLGRGRIVRCLEAHADEISKPCYEAIEGKLTRSTE